MDIERPVGADLNRDLVSHGEQVEKELNGVIERMHDKRVREEGRDRAEEALWREAERREAAKREQERYHSTLVAEKHLRDVYFRRFREKDRRVSELEGDTA